jgi:ABC-type dipeptide/oligopeptide/nickel transport system ATPase component
VSSLEIIDLKTHFPTSDGIVRAVDAITLSIGEKETFGVIGETGCGKMETEDGHSSEERLPSDRCAQRVQVSYAIVREKGRDA